MNKILLINPGHDNKEVHEKSKEVKYRKVSRKPPPMSLFSLATYVELHGFEVEIIDTHIEKNYKKIIEEKVKKNDYICVGMTIIVGRFIKNAKEILTLIRNIKPNLPVVWGGVMASVRTEDCLKEYKPDYIVRFEGEETFLELVQALKEKTDVSSINGLSYIRHNKVVNNPPRYPKLNLDDYPISNWEIFGNYFNKNQVPYYYFILTSRGCVFNCKFCFNRSIDEHIRAKVPPWRYRSAKHVIAEIDYINKKTGTKVFSFGDDNFFVNKKRALKIINYCKKNNFYIEECPGHLNCIDDKLIEAMAGVVQTFTFSIEASSPRLQKYINKNLDLASIPIKMKKLYNKGIATSIGFIFGFPTETDEDLKCNIDLMFKIKKNNPFSRGSAFLFLPLPKTPLYDEVEKIYKIKLPVNIHEWEDASYWVKGEDDEHSRKFRPWISKERFNFLVNYGNIFNEVFAINNLTIDKNILQILKNNLKLKKMFKDINQINYPKTDYRPYVLDRVLNGEKIDLINDLKNK